MIGQESITNLVIRAAIILWFESLMVPCETFPRQIQSGTGSSRALTSIVKVLNFLFLRAIAFLEIMIMTGEPTHTASNEIT